jgi:hypothetical protein
MINHDAILSVLEGATGTAVFVAVAKHMPEWPLTWKGIYDWVKGSIQEVAAQRSGQVNPQQDNPKK